MLEKFITLMIVGRDEEKGATATEYGLLVGLIALVIIFGVTTFGGNLNTFFDGLATDVGKW
jgi:pilus assembly protein Flp/PilA